MTAITTRTDLAAPSPLTLLTIMAGDLHAHLLEGYLTSGVRLLSLDLVEAGDRRVAVDLRLPDEPQHADASLHDAVVELVRGLVQGFVAEGGSDIGPVNVVISTEGQETDRMTTWRFLGDPDGGFARGATLDLRAHR